MYSKSCTTSQAAKRSIAKILKRVFQLSLLSACLSLSDCRGLPMISVEKPDQQRAQNSSFSSYTASLKMIPVLLGHEYIFSLRNT